MGNCCNSYVAPSCSRNPEKGHSFMWRGPWEGGTYYYNDDYVTDFVSYKNVILACERNHLSDAEVEPTLIYDEQGNPIGVDSQYWSFVLCSVTANDWNDLQFKIENGILSYSIDGGNTWTEVGQVKVPIVDNLTSTASDKALSANQGRILNEKINNLSDSAVKSVKMNGTTYNPVSGVVDLGNVVTTINNTLTSDATDEALSAAQGKELKRQIDAIPTVGTLKTNNTSAQSTSASESLSGVVNLHKVSKTGSYNDLLNKPTIPSTAVLYTSQSLNTNQKTQARINIAVNAKASTIPSGGMLPNMVYNLGTIDQATTFTCAAGSNSEYAHYYFTFSTGNTAPTITWPSILTSWGNGQVPLIGANKYYEISILNGVGLFIES